MKPFNKNTLSKPILGISLDDCNLPSATGVERNFKRIIWQALKNPHFSPSLSWQIVEAIASSNGHIRLSSELAAFIIMGEGETSF